MKKRTLSSLLSIAATVGLLTACGNSSDTAVSAMNVSTTPAETSTVIETKTTIATETGETAATETASIEMGTITETEIQSETEMQSETESREEKEQEIKDESTDTFTVTPLNQVMYTQKACNVREKPSTEYGVMAYLDKSTEVKVTGKVNEADWYEVSINDEKGYISASLLSDTKPAEQQATQNTNTDTPAQTPSKDGYTPNGDGTYTDEYGDKYGTDSHGNIVLINPDTGKAYENGERTQNGWIYGANNPNIDF